MSEPNRVSGRSTSPALVKVFFGSNMQISFCIFPPFTCICNRTTLQTVTSPVCSLLTIFVFHVTQLLAYDPGTGMTSRRSVLCVLRVQGMNHSYSHALTHCTISHNFCLSHSAPHSFRRDHSLPGGHTESHFLCSTITTLFVSTYRSGCHEKP